jgi:hypothetical protein
MELISDKIINCTAIPVIMIFAEHGIVDFAEILAPNASSRLAKIDSKSRSMMTDLLNCGLIAAAGKTFVVDSNDFIEYISANKPSKTAIQPPFQYLVIQLDPPVSSEYIFNDNDSLTHISAILIRFPPEGQHIADAVCIAFSDKGVGYIWSRFGAIGGWAVPGGRVAYKTSQRLADIARLAIQFISHPTVTIERTHVCGDMDSVGSSVEHEDYYLCRINHIQVRYVEEHTPSNRQSPHMHDVRGHLRQLPSGFTTWVRAHQRGSGTYHPKIYRID